MKVKPHIILHTSRKHVNYEEDKNKEPMNKPYNIQNTNICNGICHISFFKALLINEGETTRGEREYGQNDPERTGIGAKRLGAKRPGTIFMSYPYGASDCGSCVGDLVWIPNRTISYIIIPFLSKLYIVNSNIT